MQGKECAVDALTPVTAVKKAELLLSSNLPITVSNEQWKLMPRGSICGSADSDVPDTLPLSAPSLEFSVNTEYSSSHNSVASIEQDRRVFSEVLPVDLVRIRARPGSKGPRTDKLQSFSTLRVTYLLVTLVIMLADGLQGTHLYVLYEGYGFSVASLYCLGFMTGGILSPITGPLVDRIGRKKAAVLYCALEMFINGLEQYPVLIGLIASRMIGGFTTNLLASVFETWLDTEYRRRGLEKEKYEIIMRDSVIVSNSAAIFSGYLAHVLAEHYGAVGPFQGAVSCTAIALIVVAFVWTENYGSKEGDGSKDMVGYFREAVSAFQADDKMLRVGVIQGLSAGSIQIFIFLWAPALRDLAHSAFKTAWGLDSQSEPAYGLIFGAYMACGVLGGLLAPYIRQRVTDMLSPVDDDDDMSLESVEVDGEEVKVRPMAVEFLAAFCYFVSALLLAVPCIVGSADTYSFSKCLAAFLLFEVLIGVFLPCEGVIRSLYFPATARASVMSLPRIVVNFAVALGVISTNFVSLSTAFAAVSTMMLVCSGLQLSLLSQREWSSLLSRFTASSETSMPPLSYVPLALRRSPSVNVKSKKD